MATFFCSEADYKLKLLEECWGMLLPNLFFFFFFFFFFSGRREISTTNAHKGRKGEEVSPPARSL